MINCFSQLGRLLDVDEWGIAALKTPISSLLTPGLMPPPKWLHIPTPDKFVADPMPLHHNGTTYLFFEQYEHSKGKGDLCVGELDAGGQLRWESKILTATCHMSYPYSFHFDGQAYLIPETAEAREVTLFEAVEFPLKWSRVGALLSGIPALDSTVFQHESLWWLMSATRVTRNRYDLLLFHSNNPLGPWTPHQKNPVQSNKTDSRPAGPPFYHNGRLYRPAQESAHTYGGSISLKQITELSPSQFSEDSVLTVGPLLGSPLPQGIHTLTAAGGWTFFDAKRISRRPHSLPGRIRRYLQKRLCPSHPTRYFLNP